MTVTGIEEAYKKPISTWNENDVNLKPEDCGLKASPTQILRSFAPPPKDKGEVLTGTPKELAGSLVAKLSEKHVI